MKINKGYIAAGLVIAFMLFFEIAAHADAWDQSTKLTFSQPVQIPGQVLPAGSYLIKLANPDTDRNIVQVFNPDGTHLYATLHTASAERETATGDTVITMAEGTGEPDALLKWFYPGNLTGNEFVYSEQKEKELGQDRVRVVLVHQQTGANSDSQAVGE